MYQYQNSSKTFGSWVLGFGIWDLGVSKTCDIVQIPEIIQAPNPPVRKPETQRIRCWYTPSLIEALMWAKFQVKIRNFWFYRRSRILLKTYTKMSISQPNCNWCPYRFRFLLDYIYTLLVDKISAQKLLSAWDVPSWVEKRWNMKSYWQAQMNHLFIRDYGVKKRIVE